MFLTIETVLCCLLFFLCCYLGTGTDEKNVRSYRSYPAAVQKMLREDPVLCKKIKNTPVYRVFLSNIVLFSAVFLPFGIFIRESGFLPNFLNILIIGQSVNGFDLLMDLLWFRSTKRTRFHGTEENDLLYQDPRNHLAAFFRGIPAFAIVAVIDGLILSLL